MALVVAAMIAATAGAAPPAVKAAAEPAAEPPAANAAAAEPAAEPPAANAAAAEPAPRAAAARPVDAAGAHRARHRFALTPRVAHLAQVVVPTAVRARPTPRARRSGLLRTEARWGGGPVRLLVLRSAAGPGGRRWLRVRLQERPNDRAGWIPADRVRVTRTGWRVVVSTGSRTVEVRRRGRLVKRFGAVVGAAVTPTPHGLFAIGERIRQPPGVLGPWALHLTAHSNVLLDYGGGPGRVAIHGRSGALLANPLGTAASHGCIRIDNAAVAWLASRAVEGTPVLVRR